MSSLLLVDIGNSRLKWACVDTQRSPIEQDKKLWNYYGAIDTKLLSSEEHRKELAHYMQSTIPAPTEIGICSVASQSSLDFFSQILAPWGNAKRMQLLGNSPFPQLRTQYQNTHTLGADRWAGLIAARQLSNDNTLVINAGTATTIDFLGSNGLHYGGWILPGLGLMQQSLLDNTAGLQVARIEQNVQGIGLDTASAIEEGALLAHIGAVLCAIRFAQQQNQPITRIWIDGGHADLLHNRLITNQITAQKVNGLVLRGLWAWLNTHR